MANFTAVKDYLRTFVVHVQKGRGRAVGSVDTGLSQKKSAKKRGGRNGRKSGPTTKPAVAAHRYSETEWAMLYSEEKVMVDAMRKAAKKEKRRISAVQARMRDVNIDDDGTVDSDPSVGEQMGTKSKKLKGGQVGT